MKNKGFTLIELLAVIVILAIISAITVPVVIGIIDRVRIASYKESVRSIFEATNIYIASENFQKFPSEGINVTNSVIRIKNKNFTSGKVILNEQGNLEVDKVSNGRYCAGGILIEIVVVEGSCDQLDVTPPTVTLTSNLVTSSSITVVAVGEDLESGINGYQFSKDNGITWTSKQISNVYTFNNLTNNTDYIFRVRAINNNQLSTISDSITVRTNDIPIPTYSINTTDWVASAVVTIMYPTREAGYIYQYSLDNALTWLIVDAPAVTKDITFNDNGGVIARILDGTNEISGTSYTVTNIDKYNPSVEIGVVGNPFNAGGWAKANFNLNIQGIDNESGVKSYTYCQTTSSSCIPNILVNQVNGTVTVSTESTTNKVCAFSTDNVNNNSSVVCSGDYKLDKTTPAVAFVTNGNTTYAKTRSTTVTVSDTNSGVLASSLKYLWNTSTTAPAEATFSTAFANGGTLSTPAGVTGGYYLWILGKDNAGSTIITRSNVFNLDNTIPIITVTPEMVNVDEKTTYTDTGITASDNINGNITTSIITTGSVNTNVVGQYTLTYNVTDSSGNTATTKTRTVNVIAVNEFATGTTSVISPETISVSGLGFTPTFVVFRGYADELRYIALASTPQTTTGLADDAYTSYLNVSNTTCTKTAGGFTYVIGDNGRNKFGTGTIITWHAYETYDATGTATVDANETITVSGLSFTPSVVIVRGYADNERYIALASTPQTTTGLADDAYTSYLNVGNTTCTKTFGGFTYVLGDNGRNKFGSGTVVTWYAFK